MLWAVLAAIASVYTGGTLITYGLLSRRTHEPPPYQPRHKKNPKRVQRAHNRLRRPPRPITDALRWPALLALLVITACVRARSDERSPV